MDNNQEAVETTPVVPGMPVNSSEPTVPNLTSDEANKTMQLDDSGIW